jgi:MinD superfamily P-loop ATPase
MILAVASGKGGTGKTTVAVALALSAPGPVRLLDCDVEEPNAHLFLKPEIREREPVCIPVPSVDEPRCNACGECGRVCQYHAIVPLPHHRLVFPELCHGCGGCAKVCPTGAITEVDRVIGVVESGSAGHVGFAQGRLEIGHPMSPPLIRAVRRRAGTEGLTVIDCPPGTSCPVVAAVRGSDYVLLVTEPTPFGLHDLKLAVETVRKLGLPFGVIVNRADSGDPRVFEYCGAEGIPVLLRLQEDRRVAEAYSRGEPLVEARPGLRGAFAALLDDVARSTLHVKESTDAHL